MRLALLTTKSTIPTSKAITLSGAPATGYVIEHGLSVVVPGQDKGKSYAEYTAEKQGTSYKAKLKTAIDTLIPQVKDFDELLRRLQEMGYEIKQGKYISFRAAGQERFTRTKTLGAAYTEKR